MQVAQQNRKKTDLASLKVMIIEDAFESRGLIKSHLKQFGVKQITMLENGSSILLDNTPLDIDVLLIGFGLGNCHSGIELVYELTQSGMLPVWCKVIFITNADVVASSSHPFRYIKCEVLRKPINPRYLLNLIVEGFHSIHYFKSVLLDLSDNQFEGLLIRLEALPRGELSNNQKDELAAITMHLVLRLGEGNKAWKLANSIQDEVFRTTNRLSIANALGDERKLKITLGMLQANPLMHKRSLMYQIYQAINLGKYGAALILLQTQPSHKYSLAETELCALLMLETNGLQAAVRFLSFKHGTTLENVFFRNSIKLMIAKCYLYLFLTDTKLAEEMPDDIADFSEVLKKTDWQRGSVNFTPKIPVMRLCLDLILQPENENQHPVFRRLEDNVKPSDVFSQLLLATCANLLKKDDNAREHLLNADQVMLSLEVTPESMVNQLWFQCIFEMLFTEPERAREYNRIGIYNAKADNPYQALKMFFKSHICSPNHASIAINLLDAKSKLGLTQYGEIDSQHLVKKIESLQLRDNEKRKFAQVKTKINALTSTKVD